MEPVAQSSTSLSVPSTVPWQSTFKGATQSAQLFVAVNSTPTQSPETSKKRAWPGFSPVRVPLDILEGKLKLQVKASS